MLKALTRWLGQILFSDQLMHTTYTDGRPVSDRKIGSYIRKLRAKVKIKKVSGSIITSVGRAAYRFDLTAL